MKSDNELQNDIRDELLRRLPGQAERLSARVFEGVVTLTGRVNSDSEKWSVEDAIRRMPGVLRLNNDIEVLAIETPGSGAAADTARPWFPPR